MKTTLKLLGVEKKTSQKGVAYTSFQTSEGWMSCFEQNVVDKLMNHIGQEVEVSVATRGDFKNIVAFYVDATTMIGKDVIDTPNTAGTGNQYIKDKFSEARASKDTSIYTSYAKDLFITFLENTKKLKTETDLDPVVMMQLAIDLVKQAKEAFK